MQSAIRSVYWSRWFSYNKPNIFSPSFSECSDSSIKYSHNEFKCTYLIHIFRVFWSEFRWDFFSLSKSEEGSQCLMMVMVVAMVISSVYQKKTYSFPQPWWYKLLIRLLFVYYNKFFNISAIFFLLFFGYVVIIYFCGRTHTQIQVSLLEHTHTKRKKTSPIF